LAQNFSGSGLSKEQVAAGHTINSVCVDFFTADHASQKRSRRVVAEKVSQWEMNALTFADLIKHLLQVSGHRNLGVIVVDRIENRNPLAVVDKLGRTKSP
jgi:hypothetical protein